VRNPSYQFGVSEFTTWPWTFEQDVQGYAQLQVDAIEVCEFKLNRASIDAQLALIAQRGLAISSVQPSTRTLFPSQSQPEPKDVGERMSLFRRTIERFGAGAAGLPFVTNTGIPPNGNIQQVMDTAARDYRTVADFAADRGARVALEPLNATIMNVESAIWTLQDAMRVVEAVDRPNFGICLDIWNVWHLRRPVERLAHPSFLSGPIDRRSGRDPSPSPSACYSRQWLSRTVRRRNLLRRRARLSLGE
jgi:sugar phosphate isomerase/epimerase